MFDTFCLGLNAIIGSGIFIFPGLLAKEVGPASILAFGVCGVLLVFVALCYAELGSMFRAKRRAVTCMPRKPSARSSVSASAGFAG